MSSRSVVAIFDFDKTLVTQDSFRLFSLSAAGAIWKRCLVFILAVLCKVRLFNNQTYKARVLEQVWSTRSEEEKKKFLNTFFSTLHGIENSSVLLLLKQHLAIGDRVIVISASPEFYLQPFVQTWSKDIAVFGTRVRYFDRRVEVDNLYGKSKASLAKSLMERYSPASIFVYTDHISDLELIRLATDVRLVSPSNRCIRMLRKLNIAFETVYP